ncbi:3353_t:CDS:2 [Paraglomus occultum]|uniref:3353_t:CDS:1 n=1 Tax=Paraglomus occultum TaxID=144539 RepID=A0A9N9A7E9_9GLOM|nr:3353_t:CDS:2 [Paraglomus occultum]
MSKVKVEPQKALGYQFPIQKVSYNKRDIILYALSIGCEADELRYTYELDKQFAPFPTYPIVLSLKGNTNDVNLFAERTKFGGPIPGLPPLDPNKMIQGEQSLEVLNKLPVEGEFDLQTTVTGIYDKGSGLVFELTSVLIDPNTKVQYAKTRSQTFVIGYGGFGGPKGGKSLSYSPPKNKAPDAVVSAKTLATQALLYRLSGDYNPLHADPTIGAELGFGGVILHGLCTFGHAAHAILKTLGNNDPSRLVSITGRSSVPVYPGDTLDTYMWKLGEGKVVYLVKVRERDVIVLTNGLAVLKEDQSASKL